MLYWTGGVTVVAYLLNSVPIGLLLAKTYVLYFAQFKLRLRALKRPISRFSALLPPNSPPRINSTNGT